jgi:hypothetical protein
VGGQSPSPDWEYYSLDDNTTANARLALIANALRRIAEGRGGGKEGGFENERGVRARLPTISRCAIEGEPAGT